MQNYTLGAIQLMCYTLGAIQLMCEVQHPVIKNTKINQYFRDRLRLQINGWEETPAELGLVDKTVLSIWTHRLRGYCFIFRKSIA
jgi:hypothetical protein